MIYILTLCDLNNKILGILGAYSKWQSACYALERRRNTGKQPIAGGILRHGVDELEQLLYENPHWNKVELFYNDFYKVILNKIPLDTELTN
jgi:hypothetical protein